MLIIFYRNIYFKDFLLLTSLKNAYINNEEFIGELKVHKLVEKLSQKSKDFEKIVY